MKINDTKYIDILGLRIISRRKHEVLEYVWKYLNLGSKTGKKTTLKTVKPLTIFTPNAEIVVYSQSDNEFRKIVNQADLMLPDGIGLVLAAQIFYGKKGIEKIAGVDFMAKLCAGAAKQGFTIGLIGGRAGLALDTLECLKGSYNKLQGWADGGPEVRIESGKWKMENREWLDHIARTIRKTNTKIVFVAFGHPKQEYIIEVLATRLKKLKYAKPIVLMAVGGSFYFLSGRIPRAPVWIQGWGLEWAYRLVREPWRIRRQMALPRFVWLVVKERFSSSFPSPGRGEGLP